MAQILTFRLLLEDGMTDALREYIKDIPKDVVSDAVCEIHELPTFIADSIANDTYVQGDFNRELHVGTRLVDGDKHEITTWSTLDDGETLVTYKYDTLPDLDETMVVSFAD